MPMTTDVRIEYLPLSEISRWPRNPKAHATEEIQASIKRFGFVSPLVMDEATGRLVAGHGRLEALEKIKAADPEGPAPNRIEEHDSEWFVPVLRGVAFGSEQEAEAFLLADNRLNELGGWDEAALAAMLGDLRDNEASFAATGFSEGDLDAILANAAAADPVDPLAPSEGGESKQEEAPKDKLADRFLVPPFTVLDARQGYWQDRKRAWIGLGIKSELGRGDHIILRDDDDGESLHNLRAMTPGGNHRPAMQQPKDGKTVRGDGSGKAVAFKAQSALDKIQNQGKKPKESTLGAIASNQGTILGRTGKYATGKAAANPVPSADGNFRIDAYRGVKPRYGEKNMAFDGGPMPEDVNIPRTGTSIFDPVLTELNYRWFCPPGGSILDPFAGGSVRGVVSAKLGRAYTGVDLRPEQVEANGIQWEEISGQTGGSLLSGFARVTPADAGTFAPYFEGYSKTRKYPRFFQSPAYLAHDHGYLWGIVDDCLVVVKRRFVMGNHVLYLILPPMSKDGDVTRERAVLDRFRAANVGAKLSEEDVALYGLDAADVTRDKDSEEFIYAAGYAVNPPGRDGKELRNTWAKGMRYVEAGDYRVDVYDTAPPAEVYGKAKALAKAWEEHRNKSSQVKLLDTFVDRMKHGHGALFLTVTAADGTLVYYELDEQVGSGACLVSGLRNYDHKTPFDLGRFTHVLLSRAWTERLGPDAPLNSGAAVRGGEGLQVAKGKLKPEALLPIFTLKTARRMTREEWDATVPSVSFMTDAGPAPRWICGDSLDLDNLLPEGEQFDFVFTCPPYGHLEVYSDDPRDISTLEPADFLVSYRQIIAAAVRRLKEDRFAAIVVGDYRDKGGFYVNFVSETIAAFQDAGARLYNEAILLTAIGSLPIRAGRQFEAGRKLGKTHQNVLVFVKGDPKRATEACGPVVIDFLPDPAEGADEGTPDEAGQVLE